MSEPIALNSIDGPFLDAFGRLRTSLPSSLFDSKQLADKNPLFWDEDIQGSATSVHSSVNAATTMSVTGAGDSVIRQTFTRFNYQPGKSQLVFLTGVLGAPTAQVKRRIGYFNENDGLFFELDGETPYVVERKDGVDNRVAQIDWNLDTGRVEDVEGAVTLDFSKTLIFVIDFEWLGVGRVRMGVVVGGNLIYLHQFLHSNILTSVYMSTPNLPCRYEISSTGGAGSMQHICCSVISEGGVQANGLLRHVYTDNDINANTVGTWYALIGIQLQADSLGTAVDVLDVSMTGTTSDPFHWALFLNPDVAGTFTYNDLASSGLQVAYGDQVGNPSTNVVTNGTSLGGAFVSNQIRQGAKEIVNARRLGVAIDGTRDTIVLAVRPLGANLDIIGGMTWREVQ